MITPTIGRVVWYNAGDNQMHAATVACVHSDSCVNLAIVDGNGEPYSRNSVPLFQGAAHECPQESCCWMPYQQQQAAKHEAENTISSDEQEIEKEIQAKNLTAPRVTLEGMHEKIIGSEIVKHISTTGQVLRWAVLTMENGFAVTGKPSCSVSPENDNAALGEKIALQNAQDEVWALEGYALKQKLHEAK